DFAKSAQTWDASFRVPLTDEVWFDEVDANRAITRRVYDMSTGNVLQRFKPVQNAANTTSTTYTYDDRRMFVATEVNELDHLRSYPYEPGTGVLLSTVGPNIATCASTSCPSGTVSTEQHTIRLDGLGRMIERYETFSDDGAAYSLYTVETNAYADSAFARFGS